MELTAHVEAYADCLPELKQAYPDHWRELAVSDDIPLKPQYEAYHRLADADQLLVVTLRDADGTLAAYFQGFIFPELHYESCLGCFGDIFYVLPRYRGGFAGLRLLRAVLKEAKRLGVQRCHITSKLRNAAGENKDSGALLRRLGFEATEVHYSKRLDL
jgi:GNAT superfamily N-acetyltransferase